MGKGLDRAWHRTTTCKRKEKKRKVDMRWEIDADSCSIRFGRRPPPTPFLSSSNYITTPYSIAHAENVHSISTFTHARTLLGPFQGSWLCVQWVWAARCSDQEEQQKGRVRISQLSRTRKESKLMCARTTRSRLHHGCEYYVCCYQGLLLLFPISSYQV
ncbi:hypothetical protein BU24DRAFT_417779, partial [Aaosphaeria arxii CBS 175.79]